MEIIKTPKGIPTRTGRDTKYPFAELKPGVSIKIENSTVTDLLRVRSALYQFKRYKNLDWQTSVRLSENTIYVSRF
ncbi:MAG: hypothetical protein V4721_08990 [Bacteroidota bacterium]